MSAKQTCRFYMVPVRKYKESTPRYVEYVHIRPIGTPHSEYKGPAKDSHRSMFAREYGEFLSGKKNLAVGEPITSLPNMEKRTQEMLMQHGITTIEQLADIEDNAILTIPDGKILKRKAKAYMAVMLDDGSEDAADTVVVKRGRKPKQVDSMNGSSGDDTVSGSGVEDEAA